MYMVYFPYFIRFIAIARIMLRVQLQNTVGCDEILGPDPAVDGSAAHRRAAARYCIYFTQANRPPPTIGNLTLHFDVVIVGSGIAGLSVALSLAPSLRVAVIAKRASMVGASDWAQGGIAAVLDSTDAIDHHVRDTLIAGAGICDESAVRYIAQHGPTAIEWLIDQGANFTIDHEAERGYHLTREGGHSHRRIIHAADTTGHAVLSALTQRLHEQSNVTLFEHYHALDLIAVDLPDGKGKTCLGIRCLMFKKIESWRSMHRTLCWPRVAQDRSI